MFRTIWSTLVGLLIEDGQLAIGALLALAITWALATAGAQQVVGWVLLAIVLFARQGLVGLVVARRQHHDGHRRTGPDLPAHVEPVHVGQPEVEDHDVVAGGRREGVMAGRHLVDEIALPPEGVHQRR